VDEGSRRSYTGLAGVEEEVLAVVSKGILYVCIREDETWRFAA